MSAKGLLRFEELEVFNRAYGVSIEIHKVSLGFPKIEQFGLADQIRRASEVDLREPRRRLGEGGVLEGRIKALCTKRAGIGRRNASVAAILFRSGIHQRI
jgi:23S rRNA-intervening sequence protein